MYFSKHQWAKEWCFSVLLIVWRSVFGKLIPVCYAVKASLIRCPILNLRTSSLRLPLSVTRWYWWPSPELTAPCQPSLKFTPQPSPLPPHCELLRRSPGLVSPSVHVPACVWLSVCVFMEAIFVQVFFCVLCGVSHTGSRLAALWNLSWWTTESFGKFDSSSVCNKSLNMHQADMTWAQLKKAS